MAILIGEQILHNVGRILAYGGMLGLVSPYLSDFKYWGDGRGSTKKQRKYLTELLLSATLEEDGRIFLVTDPESPSRHYSKHLIQEITSHEFGFWIYLFTVPGLHAKLIYNDGEAIVGSANLTYSAFKRNIEIGFHVTEQDDLSRIKQFVNSLIFAGTPGNRAAEDLKNKLSKVGLWNQENIFDLTRLIAYAHYLLRTTRIHCILHSLDEPSELSSFRIFLNTLESDYEEHNPSLEKLYKALTDSTDAHMSSYYAEELQIAVRKIADVRKVFDHLITRDITGSFNYTEYLGSYENKYQLPPTKVWHVINADHMRIVSKLVEEKLEKE